MGIGKAAILLGVIMGAMGAIPAAQAQETVTYSYDAQGRLIATSTTNGPNSGTQTGYTLDKADNRKTATVTGAPQIIFVVPLSGGKVIKGVRR